MVGRSEFFKAREPTKVSRSTDARGVAPNLSRGQRTRRRERLLGFAFREGLVVRQLQLEIECWHLRNAPSWVRCHVAMSTLSATRPDSRVRPAGRRARRIRGPAPTGTPVGSAPRLPTISGELYATVSAAKPKNGGRSSPIARVGTTWALPPLSPPLLTRPITSGPSGKSLRG